MRTLLPLLLVACTGSPDAVTVTGGHGVGQYDSAAGPRSYNSSSNEVGLELTWFLPSTRTMRQDADAAELLRLGRSMEQLQRAALERREPASATTVTVEAPTVELPPGFGSAPENKPEDDEDAELKVTITRVTRVGLIAVLAILATVFRKPIQEKGGNVLRRLKRKPKGPPAAK